MSTVLQSRPEPKFFRVNDRNEEFGSPDERFRAPIRNECLWSLDGAHFEDQAPRKQSCRIRLQQSAGVSLWALNSRNAKTAMAGGYANF
jgi:hypothetical protein